MHRRPWRRGAALIESLYREGGGIFGLLGVVLLSGCYVGFEGIGFMGSGDFVFAYLIV